MVIFYFQNNFFTNAGAPATMLTLKPPPSQKDTKTQPCMSDKPASTSRWAVARTARSERGTRRRRASRDGRGTPLAKVRHKCLKRRDSEKTMKGNERSFTASRAFHGVPAAATSGFANSASAVEGRDFGVADFGAQAFENDRRPPVFECSDLTSRSNWEYSGCCRRDTPCSALAAVKNATRPSRGGN